LIDYLNTHIAYWHWIIFGIFLAAGEILAPSFVMLLLGVAAVIVGLISYSVQLAFSTQLIVWMIFSALNTLVWFKLIMPNFKTKSLSGMAKEEAIGAEGMVVNFDVNLHKGIARFTIPLLGQAEWTIISDDELNAGDIVRVTNISGNTLIATRR